MADMTTLDLTKETLLDSYATAEIVAGAASLTIDMDGAKACILRVENNDAAADAYVHINYGTGLTASKGDKVHLVEFGDTAYIRIEDTSRHVTLSTEKITVGFEDADGVALGAAILSDLVIEAILI